jgi:hypothetical protein
MSKIWASAKYGCFKCKIPHTFYVPVIAVTEREQPNIGLRNSLKNK